MNQNKVAIITGGSEGIGYGIAEALAARGTHVYLVARKIKNLEVAKKKIQDQGGKADFYTADIKQTSEIKEIIDKVVKENERLDIFVNNAGGYKSRTIESNFGDIKEDWDFLMRAPLEITHYLVQLFKNERKNKLDVLTIVSQAAFSFLSSGLGYGTAKTGLMAGLYNLDLELKRQGIDHINLYRVYPGTVATEASLSEIRSGVLQNPTTLESVVETAMDLLDGRTPSRDAYVGYVPGQGIKRIYFDSNPENFWLLPKVSETIIDANFDPRTL